MRPATVTVTSTTPLPAGLVAVQLVTEAQLTAVAAVAPNFTVLAPAAVAKLVPLMVTGVPPAAEPFGGMIPVTVGAGVIGVQDTNLNEPMRVCQSSPVVP